MSAWRLAIRALHQLGGDASTAQIAQAAGDLTAKQVSDAMTSCRLHGLAVSARMFGPKLRSNHWTLTDLGRGYCAGTVRAVNNHVGRREFVAVCPHCGCVPP